MSTEKDTKDKTPSIAKETMKQCKILYCQKDLPMTKTCMCWGWECGEGWHNSLHKLSCALEALNILYYKTHKVRIQADQVKEKFGTLHFYFSVACDNFTEEGLEAQKVIDAFEKCKNNGYFGIKTVTDEQGYSSTCDVDGEKRTVWHPPKFHTEVTLHKEEYERMKAAADKATEILIEKGRYEPTDEQKILMTFLENEADRLIREAEKECYDSCEMCGRQIGTKSSPRVQTKGWVRFVCKECAEKLDNPRN